MFIQTSELYFVFVFFWHMRTIPFKLVVVQIAVSEYKNWPQNAKSYWYNGMDIHS